MSDNNTHKGVEHSQKRQQHTSHTTATRPKAKPASAARSSGGTKSTTRVKKRRVKRAWLISAAVCLLALAIALPIALNTKITNDHESVSSQAANAPVSTTYEAAEQSSPDASALFSDVSESAGAVTAMAEATKTPSPSESDASPTESPPSVTEEPLPILAPEVSFSPAPTATPAPSAEPKRYKADYPYAIVVDRGKQVVTILTIGETGAYDVVARQMICSTDKYDKKPTNGVYAMEGDRKKWLSTVTGSYAQYATRISATILFHSVPYNKKREDSLMTKEYYKLGQNVSEGCVRLTCEDAKWIYDNIPSGTLVRFVSGDYDEELLQSLFPPALVSGNWDPTDPASNNPDFIGGSYHDAPVATPYPYVTPAPTSYKLSKWKRPS